jgi:hypothetical protein
VLAAALAATQPALEPEPELPQGYTPSDEASQETLRLTGYVDVGFAKASGDGTSFAAGDVRLPAEYGVDPFATAVNSRGDVASTDASGRFTNGFLPKSVGIGGRPSFLLNTGSVDLRFTPRQLPLFLFVRLQAMPRLEPGGDATQFDLQQAFGKVTPFSSQEFAASLGRFDSVFGIEYLENEANFRVGVTPSLLARYTTGHSIGLKAFYRVQVPALASALSLNLAATNNGARTESLVGPDASLTGVPVGTGRLGYELNLKDLQVKAGASGLYGPRNDQHSAQALQSAFGVDLRISFMGVSLAGEFLRLADQPGPVAGKQTGLGPAELASGFQVRGGWARLAWTLPWHTETLTGLTVYGRYDQRRAQFEGYTQAVTDRLTAGVRADLTELLALKIEALWNRELSGAPTVDNDVVTSSAVFTW